MAFGRPVDERLDEVGQVALVVGRQFREPFEHIEHRDRVPDLALGGSRYPTFPRLRTPVTLHAGAVVLRWGHDVRRAYRERWRGCRQ